MAKKRKRADYGAGSVYQESDGSWRVAIRLKEGEKPIRRRAPDRASAERLLAELRAQRDAGLDVRKGFQALEDFTDYWFNEVYLQRGNSERADKHTLDMLELHILPQLGKLALTAIDHARLQQFINDLRRRPNKAPLAPQTVHHVYSVLKQVFGKAVAMNVLSRDPTLNLELPEIQPADRPLLETTQIRALLDFVTNHPHGFAYHAMAVLGLRLGEALALRRIDFNQDFTEVTINQQISYHSRKLIAPKRQSIRLLAVPPMLAAVAAAQWQRVLAIHGTDFASGGLMSPSEAGTPIQPSNFEKTWRGHTQRRILKAGPKAYVHAGIRAGAGLPASATLHDLRRHLATILADLDTAQRGHNCHKCNKIRKMWQEGRDYHAIKVFHTDDEKLALDKECELIAEIGSFRLCNLTGGGEGKTIPQHVIQERVIRITQNMRDMEVKKQSIQALNHFRMKKELAIIDARLKEERKARRLAAKTRP